MTLNKCISLSHGTIGRDRESGRGRARGRGRGRAQAGVPAQGGKLGFPVVGQVVGAGEGARVWQKLGFLSKGGPDLEELWGP